MTEKEAIAYIEQHTWSVTRLGLDRTRVLLESLGNPQRKLKFIHVTGSNGKGSTCAMLDSILRRAGYRTGLYTSPYIQDFGERIQVNGEKIPDSVLAAITERVRSIADRMEDHPSQFEMVTAIAMVYFLECSCDIVVLEVGMGGALDSTNVIDSPEVAVFTNIGLEHTEYLGHTLEAIAETKAGIVKPGCDAVCYDGATEAVKTIQAVCRERKVPFHLADISQIAPDGHSLDGQEFRWRGKKMRLPLLGEYQLHNAAVALEVVQVLRHRGWTVPDEAIREGLRFVQWPARFEVLGLEPLFILDGGHNPQCMQALARNLAEYIPGRKVTFLLGILADKDYPAMLEILAPYAAGFVCLTPESPRALPAKELADEIQTTYHLPALACEDGDSAIRKSLDIGRPVVAVGSLYMAGELRSSFRGIYREWLRREKIEVRKALSEAQQRKFSQMVVDRLVASQEFQQAKTIMIYRAVPGEVQLDTLEIASQTQNKQIIYPLCVNRTEMIALHPSDSNAWIRGHYGIWEPDPAQSELISPEGIDLVICPCTVFDENCYRMGMGAGYYDRYLKKCIHAKAVAVAFECQKAPRVPAAPWDCCMEKIFTEDAVYQAQI